MLRWFMILTMAWAVPAVALAATPTDTPTDTPTFTATPTITETYTITSTFTITPTYTITPTFTSTFTITPTPTITLTVTHSPTITPTFTISPTSTVTPTATEAFNLRVSVNHNSFNPMEGQTLEVQNLTTLHGEVTVRVYSQSGTLVRELAKEQTLVRGMVPIWDGRNDRGEVVASGVYVVVVSGNKLHKRFRVAVIK
ncbi:MAG: FlgD immunoglobulin-like domain containing protein [candidate division FCPU426 bacterium]